MKRIAEGLVSKLSFAGVVFAALLAGSLGYGLWSAFAHWRHIPDGSWLVVFGNPISFLLPVIVLVEKALD